MFLGRKHLSLLSSVLFLYLSLTPSLLLQTVSRLFLSQNTPGSPIRKREGLLRFMVLEVHVIGWPVVLGSVVW